MMYQQAISYYAMTSCKCDNTYESSILFVTLNSISLAFVIYLAIKI